jgi:hypothetical protein
MGIDLKLAHYDPPPPRVLSGPPQVRSLCAEDRFRFANVLSGWIDVDDGKVVASGVGDDSGLVMGSTTVRLASFEATFRGFSLPVIRPDPQQDADRVRFIQTVGGRTSVPLPGPVPHPPFVRWQAPIVWTTLALALYTDGRSDVELVGASAFPRHWVYGPDGHLLLKSGLTDQAAWVAHSFGPRTPWGDSDSPAVIAAAETQLERQMSEQIMRSGRRPDVRTFSTGATLTEEGQPGDELFLVLDGVLGVEVAGARVGEVGPGAILGERALLEGGRRTSTLVAVTPVRVAAGRSDSIDLTRLQSLAESHRREDSRPGAGPE